MVYLESSKDSYTQQLEALENMNQVEADNITQGLMAGDDKPTNYDYVWDFVQNLRKERAASQEMSSVTPMIYPEIRDLDVKQFEDAVRGMSPRYQKDMAEGLEQGATMRTAPELVDVPEEEIESLTNPKPAPVITKPSEGLMSRPAVNDPESSGYAFMLPESKFRTALKAKEAESYSTLFGNAETSSTPFKDVDITSMTVDEVLEFTKSGGEFHEYNKKTYNKNTTAVGKYQFVGATLRDLKKRGVFKKLNISEDTKFDEATQDKLSAYLVVHRLKDRADNTYKDARKELRNEWEGFKKLSDEDLNGIIDEVGSEIGKTFK